MRPPSIPGKFNSIIRRSGRCSPIWIKASNPLDAFIVNSGSFQLLISTSCWHSRMSSCSTIKSFLRHGLICGDEGVAIALYRAVTILLIDSIVMRRCPPAVRQALKLPLSTHSCTVRCDTPSKLAARWVEQNSSGIVYIIDATFSFRMFHMLLLVLTTDILSSSPCVPFEPYEDLKA